MTNLTKERTIQRARQLAPDDERLVEASNDDAIRDSSYKVACDILAVAQAHRNDEPSALRRAL